MSVQERSSVLGRRLPKMNAVAIVTGRSEYTDDLSVPGMLHARVLRSPHAHARIVRVDVSRAQALPGVFAVVTAKNVPANRLGSSVRHRPLLADGVVHCFGEPIAAVAAADRTIAARAIELIEVEYAPLPAVFDVRAATAPGAPIIHHDKSAYPRLPALDQWFVREPGNVSHRVRIGHGDVDAALAAAPKVYRASFATQSVSQVCPESHAAMARMEPSGRLVVWCSTGKPARIHGQICGLLGLSTSRLRIEVPDVGCDFGVKGEVSIEGIVALLAIKARRPVKGTFSREEEFTGAGLRIAAEIDAALGVAIDGRILALDMIFRNDIGPYDGYGSMITVWAAVTGAGPYEIANVRLVGESIYTNNLRGASFRGFGNPQVSFARESLLDMAAKDLGIHPIELRRRNAWKHGSVTATAQELSNDYYGLGFIDTLDRLGDRFPCAEDGRADSGPIRRGVGYACGVHGSGYGCLIDADTSGAIVKLNPDGTLLLFTGAMDVGQGTTTSIVQIVAEAVGVEPTQVVISSQDTDSVPFDGGASASRQLYISGYAALKAAQSLRERILDVAAGMLEVRAEHLTIRDGVVRAADPVLTNRSVALLQLAMHAINVLGEQPIGFGSHSLQGALLDAEGKGNPIGAFLFASQRAEVEVDTETGIVRVLSLAAAHDVGRAINPMIIEGQIEGSLIQGMGYALLEEVRQHEGRPITPDLENYLVPMSADMPQLIPILVETYEPSGPLGAKGVAEAGLVPTAAAIANAIESATGARVTRLPITPERLLEALRARNAHSPRVPLPASG
jgi:CO/xanthine dehydrogenase Mo-binding subunit